MINDVEHLFPYTLFGQPYVLFEEMAVPVLSQMSIGLLLFFFATEFFLLNSIFFTFLVVHNFTIVNISLRNTYAVTSLYRYVFPQGKFLEES
jgi:hypothetical protein